jgi:hypothetical protein
MAGQRTVTSNPGGNAGISSGAHVASASRAVDLKLQLQSIFDTLPNTDFKQLLIVYMISPELV